MKEKTEWIRVCSSCKKNIVYKNKYILEIAIKKNSVCKSCCKLGRNNPNWKNLSDIFKRKCLNCKKFILYKHKSNFNIAIRKNRKCQTCCNLKNDPNKKTRNCPSCKKNIIYTNYKNCLSAERNNKKCKRCSNLGVSKSTKGKKAVEIWKNWETIREKRIGGQKEYYKRYGRWWQYKITEARKKNGTYVVRKETREKLKNILIDRKIKNGTLIWPNYNLNACNFFKYLEKKLYWNGYYATKNKEKRFGVYWVDYYEPKLNIVIEWNEKYHYKTGKLNEKDVEKMNFIKNNGIFYIVIRETKFNNYNEILNYVLEKSKILHSDYK